MADSYVVLKALHITAAVLMVGNVTVTGVWATLYWRWRRDADFRKAARAVLWTDLCFTFLGGAALTITGILLARQASLSILETPWIRRSALLLAISTLLWLTVLLPDQWRLERLDDTGEECRKAVFTRWSVVGWVSTVLLFVGLWSMVVKW
jgi:uncharacterized membrane protein